MKPSSGNVHPMIIGGGPKLASDGAIIESHDPATGAVIGAFPAATSEDVNDAVRHAATAFESWRRTAPQERAAALLAYADRITAHGEELALLDVHDNGSPISEMRNDIGAAAAQLRYFAGLVLHARGETVPAGYGRLNYTLRQPYGVVARIIAFNHPLMFAAAKMAAPLAAGNTVIIKPSEHTSLSALRLGELATEIFPPGVVSIVTGYGQTAGDALVTHPGIRRLAFIGAADTGRGLLHRSATVNIKSITLELGGKNPLIVFPDSSLDKAVDAAVRGMNFTWQGQSCGSTSRLLLHDDIYEEFLGRLAIRIGALKSGLPSDEATETGAIVNQGQLDKVQRYIALGRDEGARLVVGGDRLTDGPFADGLFVKPALFADVRPESRLAQEEIFGPVLAAMRFTDYDQALAIANSVRYGLTASVFTQSLPLAHRFARDVQAGYVWVNEVARHVPGTGFGGTKDSGLGREEDLDELLSYTESKNVHLNFE